MSWSVHAISLNCTFKEHTSYWGTKYACVVHDLNTSFNDRFVTKVLGTHIEGKTDDDVAKVMIEHQYCPYLPTNLGTHFKNIDTLYAMRSKVTHLTNNDLTGLTKLRIFDVSYNPIKRLYRDYFKGHESVEIISFYDCALNYIQEGALDPLLNLKEAHFQYNECVDFRGDDVDLLPSLREAINETCSDPYRKNLKPQSSIFDEYGNDDDDHIWHDDDSYEKLVRLISKLKPSEKSTISPTTAATTKATSATTERHPKNVVEETHPESDSFVRRNAFVIISFLVLVIALLGLLLFKINAFNRQSWR